MDNMHYSKTPDGERNASGRLNDRIYIKREDRWEKDPVDSIVGNVIHSISVHETSERK